MPLEERQVEDVEQQNHLPLDSRLETLQFRIQAQGVLVELLRMDCRTKNIHRPHVVHLMHATLVVDGEHSGFQLDTLLRLRGNRNPRLVHDDRNAAQMPIRGREWVE